MESFGTRRAGEVVRERGGVRGWIGLDVCNGWDEHDELSRVSRESRGGRAQFDPVHSIGFGLCQRRQVELAIEYCACVRVQSAWTAVEIR